MQMQRAVVALLLWAVSIAVPAQSRLPARIAPEARLDVYGTSEVNAIQNPEVLTGFGSISRVAWMKKSDQARAFTASFPLSLVAASEISLQFVPRGQGIVTISLLGYYERIASEKEALYQEEILWEKIELQGATLTPETEALLRLPVRSWFRQRYELAMQVKKDTPVILRLAARPVVPTGLEVPQPLENEETPAHRTAKLLAKGIALIGTSETVKQGLGNALARSGDLELIRREGFDHVRLTLPWHALAGKAPEFKVSSDILARVDLLIAEAAKQNLAVVLSWHDFDAFYTAPQAEAGRFLKIWTQLAGHYDDFPATIAYELLNPADNQADTPFLNSIYADVIREIRRGSVARTILCSPGRRGNPAELTRLLPPSAERNLMVSLHSREPEPFSQQSIGNPAPNRLAGIQFPGPPTSPAPPETMTSLDPNLRDWLARYRTTPPDRNPSGPKPLQEQVQWAARWSRHYRRPVYFAELGCDSRLEPTSRANYYAAWRAALREADLGWAVADWTQQHRYWDAKAQQPLPGLRQALFPEQAGQSPSADHQELLHNALRQLADLKSQVQTTERVSTEELDKLRVRASEAQTQAQQTHDLARWLMGGLLGLTLLVLASFFLRRRPLAPAARSRGDRELQLGSDPRTKGTPPQLTELLLEKVAQRLLSDRQQNRMLQLCATEELKALEQRLAELHAPIEMRLNAYEQRIQELEEELRQKGEENRELLETKIELTKQRLAVARGGGSEDWN